MRLKNDSYLKSDYTSPHKQLSVQGLFNTASLLMSTLWEAYMKVSLWHQSKNLILVRSWSERYWMPRSRLSQNRQLPVVWHSCPGRIGPATLLEYSCQAKNSNWEETNLARLASPLVLQHYEGRVQTSQGEVAEERKGYPYVELKENPSYNSPHLGFVKFVTLAVTCSSDTMR